MRRKTKAEEAKPQGVETVAAKVVATPPEHSEAGVEHPTSHVPDANALADEKIYIEERSALVKRRNELGDLFDKSRTYIAGGAIAVSATLLKELLPRATKEALFWVFVSWSLLTFALIFSLTAVYVANLSFQRATNLLDDDRRNMWEARRLNDRGNKYNLWLDRFLNPASIVLILLGVLTLGVALMQLIPTATNPTKGANVSDDQPTTNTTSGTPDTTRSFGSSNRPVTPPPSQPASGNSSTQDNSGDKKQ